MRTAASPPLLPSKTLVYSFLLHSDLFLTKEIIRTRQTSLINEADIVVGLHTTKLSSAGLIYKHFGKSVIANILQWNLDDERLDILYQKLYNDFVEGFDGVDNGISRYPVDVKPLYKDGTSISSRVARLNPWWNEKDVDLMGRFLEAVALTGREFTERVRYLGLSWLPARTLVEDGLKSRFEVNASGRVLVFEQFFFIIVVINWKKFSGIKGEDSIIYVVYPDESKKWRVQAVPNAPDSFESRKPLPEPWRGLRDNVLSEKAEISGCIFVHASGFIGGNESKENAIAMATAALRF
ncbi:metal-dependent protein hydrolase [Chytridium lagenaria]|nr:metal-dependent protein hydrolase [Chytridium lagenaria]